MKAITQTGQHQMSDNLKLILSYSFIVALVFACVFFLSRVFNLEGKTELRFVNYILLFFIVYSALSKSYHSHDNKIEYFSGFGVGFLISSLGQLWYSILFFIYLHIDHEFLSFLLNQFPRDIIYPELSISFILLIEGVSIGAVVALATMQYFKKKRGRWATTNK